MAIVGEGGGCVCEGKQVGGGKKERHTSVLASELSGKDESPAAQHQLKPLIISCVVSHLKALQKIKISI